MIAGRRHWPVRITATAEYDFDEILRWTAEHFGEQQARTYAGTLSAALEELSTGLELVGVRVRGDIARGIFALHVARHGRKGRHFAMFRIGQDQRGEVIEVLRLLHDAMDVPSHIPPIDEST